MLGALLEGRAPDLRDVVFIRSALLRGMDVYTPLNLRGHIKGAGLDSDVARALLQQLGSGPGAGPQPAWGAVPAALLGGGGGMGMGSSSRASASDTQLMAGPGYFLAGAAGGMGPGAGMGGADHARPPSLARRRMSYAALSTGEAAAQRLLSASARLSAARPSQPQPPACDTLSGALAFLMGTAEGQAPARQAAGGSGGGMDGGGGGDAGLQALLESGLSAGGLADGCPPGAASCAADAAAAEDLSLSAFPRPPPLTRASSALMHIHSLQTLRARTAALAGPDPAPATSAAAQPRGAGRGRTRPWSLAAAGPPACLTAALALPLQPSSRPRLRRTNTYAASLMTTIHTGPSTYTGPGTGGGPGTPGTPASPSSPAARLTAYGSLPIDVELAFGADPIGSSAASAASASVASPGPGAGAAGNPAAAHDRAAAPPPGTRGLAAAASSMLRLGSTTSGMAGPYGMALAVELAAAALVSASGGSAIGPPPLALRRLPRRSATAASFLAPREARAGEGREGRPAGSPDSFSARSLWSRVAGRAGGSFGAERPGSGSSGRAFDGGGGGSGGGGVQHGPSRVSLCEPASPALQAHSRLGPARRRSSCYSVTVAGPGVPVPGAEAEAGAGEGAGPGPRGGAADVSCVLPRGLAPGAVDAGADPAGAAMVCAAPPPAMIDEVERLLAGSDAWQYDTWRLAEASGGHALSALGFYLITRAGLPARLRIKPLALARALRAVEAGYADNPYHSATHAADVLQTLHVLLRGSGMATHYPGGDVGLLAAYWAAIVHDYGHPGLTNDFLVATSDPLALRYNDRSPLENHHAAASFGLLAAPEHAALLAGLAAGERGAFRKQVIEMVLATDMKQHFSLLSHFSTVHRLAGYGAAHGHGPQPAPHAAPGSPPRARCSSAEALAPTSSGSVVVVVAEGGESGRGASARRGPAHTSGEHPAPVPPSGASHAAGSPTAAAATSTSAAQLPAACPGPPMVAVPPPRPPAPLDETERMLSLQLALKVADIGHLGEELGVHRRWLSGLEEEFFRQGDRERQLGLPISPLFDRAKQGVSKSQVGFYDFVALPLAHALAAAFPGAAPMLRCFADNADHWRAAEAEARRCSGGGAALAAAPAAQPGRGGGEQGAGLAGLSPRAPASTEPYAWEGGGEGEEALPPPPPLFLPRPRRYLPPRGG